MTPSLSLKSAPALRGSGSFVVKLFFTLALVAVADAVFGQGYFGAASAAFAAAWLVGLWLARPAMRRSGGGLAAFAFAWAMALALFDDPNALAGVLFWGGLTLAAILPRAARFGDARDWGRRLLLAVFAVIATPIRDARMWAKTRRDGGRSVFAIAKRTAATLALPLGGTALFAILFAQANPIIANWFASSGDSLTDLSVAPARVTLWVVAAALVWGSLRAMRGLAFRRGARPAATPVPLSRGAAPSVMLSLILFNLLFAVQNGLDVAFLWSGAPLPDGVTLADYAHRGAYPLILTALLAGAFALFAFRPGAPGAGAKTLRRLVVVWIAQNIFLVASSALRTVDYVEAYSLTELRLAALIWMALVAIGLALICWRIVKAKSATWLVNANALALVAVLSACAAVDLGEVTAYWNVRHNAEVSGAGAALDVNYLGRLGPSALGALIEIDVAGTPEPLRARVAEARREIETRLAGVQDDWRSWTWRGSRRLAAARVAADARALTARPLSPEAAVPRAPQPPAADGPAWADVPAAPVTEPR